MQGSQSFIRRLVPVRYHKSAAADAAAADDDDDDSVTIRGLYGPAARPPGSARSTREYRGNNKL